MRSSRPLAALLLSAAAGPLAAGGAAPVPPRAEVALDAQVLQPADARTRGFGGGVQLAFHLSDQIAATADAAQLVSPAGAYHVLALGLRAVLDLTPVVPFVELSLARLGPSSTAGMGAATRTSLGADLRLGPSWSLGLELQALTALSSNGSAAAGTGLSLRVVFLPALLR